MASNSSRGLTLDPFRQTLLRELQTFLNQVTTEITRQHGENFDRQQRKEKFFANIRTLADHVVRLKENQENIRASQSVSSTTSTVRDHTGLHRSPSNASLRPQASGVALQAPDMTNLSHASLPREWSLSSNPSMPVTLTGAMSGAVGRPSVSPTNSKESSFSSMPSLQNSRAQSSESIPTTAAMSASQSPAVNNTSQNTISKTSSTSPPARSKPSTNFGFAVPQRKTPATLTELQKAAISSTAEIEAAVSGMLPPGPRDASALSQPTAASIPRQSTQQLSTSVPPNNINTDAMDLTSPSGIKKRKRQKKQWCHLCNDHKDGFRGPHELARHMNIQHQTKKTVFIVFDDSPGGSMFKDCKHCSRRKIYGQDYNAACHLRRAHFNKRMKTDPVELREFKQMHPDHPPMEELRPWLRKCLVDVSLLRDKKYIDNQDDALLKVEPAVKHDEVSSSEQDHDNGGSDDEPQQRQAGTPPEYQTEAEPEQEPEAQDTALDVSMSDDNIASSFLDFQDLGIESNMVDGTQPLSDFIHLTPPPAPPQAPPQLSAIPRTSDIFSFQWQTMGLPLDQVVDQPPAFVGLNHSTSFSMPSFEMPTYFPSNVDTNGENSFDIDDFQEFLHGTNFN
ncbi:hypothetical protein ABW19_dt0206161 [Dactylella cylindrospora]|nr:hypothetical protein ABW19_dt0206161 [Dactylella cylindrospora]